MAITPEQREARKGYIGSSDVAAILGVDKYRTAWDIWAEKTGKIKAEDQEPVSEAAEIGTMLEKAILHGAEKELGRMILNPERLEFRHDSLPIVSHPDGIIIKNNEPVDAKTSGIMFHLGEGWGEDGTDQVPEPILIQTHVHMLCTKMGVCHVPALLGGRGRVLYHINATKDLLEIIVEKCDVFWNQCVKTDTPPVESLISEQVAKSLIRIPGKVAPVRYEDVEKWLKCKENKKAVEAEEESAKATLLSQLVDAEASEAIEGLGQLTYLEQVKVLRDLDLLQANVAPEIWEKAMGETKYRVLRWKKESKKKGKG